MIYNIGKSAQLPGLQHQRKLAKVYYICFSILSLHVFVKEKLDNNKMMPMVVNSTDP